MKQAQNLSGRSFGKWVVLSKSDSVKGKSRWLCQCECGKERVVVGQTLLNGSSKCCVKCSARVGNVSHGLCKGGKLLEYGIWRSMKDRCLNSNCSRYVYYGGRGICICDEWIKSFESFYKYIGPKPFSGASVDRIDNNGNYEPGNVRWATKLQQSANTRKQKYGICVTQWSKEYNLDRFHVTKFLKEGFTLDEIQKKVKKHFKKYD